MSPIGRVFIVLNLFLAGGFAVMAGQLLNKQANYKQQLATAQEEHQAAATKLQAQIEDLKTERGNAENAKTSFETQLAAAQNSIGQLQDDNKRLSALTSSQAADLKKAVSLQESANTQAKAAFDQAQSAYQASIDAHSAVGRLVARRLCDTWTRRELEHVDVVEQAAVLPRGREARASQSKTPRRAVYSDVYT